MEHIDQETRDLIERIRQDLRESVDEHIGEYVGQMKELAESELAVGEERRSRPISSAAHAVSDAELVAQLIKETFRDPSRSPEQIRLVATIFKRFVDEWYPVA